MEQLVAFRDRPGARRGRALRAGAGDDRGHRPAPGARPLPGPDRVYVRRGVDRRPRSRRTDRRQRELALDLLRQHPGRPRRARRDRRRDSEALAQARARGRLPGRCAARGGDDVPAAGARLGRPAVPVGLLRGPRRTPGGGGLPRDLCLRGAARARADPAVRPVPNANGCGRGGRDRDLGDGDGRDDRLRAAVRAGRDRHLGDLLGRGADAVLHRSRDHERDLRAVDLAKRPLPAECPRRAGGPRRRALPALAHGRLDDELRGGAEHGHRGGRARPDDAGVRDRGPERRAHPADGLGDGADAVRPLDRRDARRDADGRDRQPASSGGGARPRPERPPAACRTCATVSPTHSSRPSWLRRCSASSRSPSSSSGWRRCRCRRSSNR